MFVRRRDLWGLPITLSPAFAETASLPAHFPSHAPELAREMVGVSHGNFKRVRELADQHPALARAAVDHGFGDWEDALGAASHVGNREIAEFLISRGARPTLFSAAMLGQLDVVKAFVAAQPGVQRIPGPHSIPLLAHARFGGKPAEPVLRYLESLGDAGAPPTAALTPEETKAFSGAYILSGDAGRLEVSLQNGFLLLARPGKAGHRLLPLGGGEFHPAGARDARVRFTADGASLTVHDGPIIFTARRAAQ